MSFSQFWWEGIKHAFSRAWIGALGVSALLAILIPCARLCSQAKGYQSFIDGLEKSWVGWILIAVFLLILFGRIIYAPFLIYKQLNVQIADKDGEIVILKKAITDLEEKVDTLKQNNQLAIFLQHHVAGLTTTIPIQPASGSGVQSTTLNKIRDLIKSTESCQLEKRYDLLGALIKYSDDLFSTNEEVVEICEKLGHEFRHPFFVLESSSNGALRGQWLDFIHDARRSREDIKNLLQAFSWAATKWKNADKWKEGRRQITGIYPETEYNTVLNEALSEVNDANRKNCFFRVAALLNEKPRRFFADFNALILAGAHHLKSNDDLVWLCNELAKNGHENPLKELGDYVPERDWLDFLQWVAVRPNTDIKLGYGYVEAAKEWPARRQYPEPTTRLPLRLTVLNEILKEQLPD
jgi:hypothetical protein